MSILAPLLDNLSVTNVKTEKPIRFDRGTFRKAEITPEGYLRAEAVFARDGILEYIDHATGKRRKELRTPESNQKVLTGFGLKPVTIEHPPVLLDSSNAKEYAVGMTDSTVYYDPGGFVRGVITIYDAEAVDLVRSGKKPEISAGYQCKVNTTPGIWKGDRYDAIQEDLEINHICVTWKGRAGPDVKVYYDSFGTAPDVAYQTNKSSSKKMARFTTPDNVTYDDIPEAFASVAAKSFSDLSEIKTYADSLEQVTRADSEQIQQLNSQLAEVEEERDRQMGRADELEEFLFKADSLLEELGYQKNNSGEYKRFDSKKDKRKQIMEEEDPEDDDDEDLAEDTDEGDYPLDESDEEQDMEDETITQKKKRMPKTKVKTDSLSDLLEMWEEAEVLIPGIKKNHFDSELTCDDIRRLVIEQVNPEKDLDGKSSAYVEATYDSIKEYGLTRQDSSYYADSLESLVNSAGVSGMRSPLSSVEEKRRQMLLNGWQERMAMTKD